MTKSHGPSLRKQQITLSKCPSCQGKAVVKGVFYEMACGLCNASGWVSASTGEPLPLEELVTQLGLLVRELEQRISRLPPPPITSGPEAQYQTNNRRGAGGTNYTGD